MAAARTHPEDLERRMRAYVAELVTPEDVEQAMAAIVDRVPAAAEPQEVFAAAHTVITKRVRVTVEVEADILVRDAGLTIAEAAAALGVPVDTVAEAVRTASEIFTELETAPPGVPATSPAEATPAQPEATPAHATPSPEPARRIVIVDDEAQAPAVEVPEPTAPVEVAEPAAPVGAEPVRPRRRVGWLTITLLLLALVGVGTLVATSGSEGCEATIQPRVGAPVEITEACVTGAVDTEGQPFEERDRFELGETVILWFSYERQTTSDFLLQLAVLRDGQALEPTPQFPLPADRSDAHITLPRVFVDRPGDYEVHLRSEGRTLASVAFAVTA